MAARRCLQCRYDHPVSAASSSCPWCGKPTFQVANATPTDDGLDRYGPQVVAWRGDLAKLTQRAQRRGVSLVDLVELHDESVPPPEVSA